MRSIGSSPRLGRYFGPALAATLLALVAVPASPAAAENDVDRVIKDKRITESSGLAASTLHPGVLWTHNDSGNAARIYAIGRNGSTEATLTLRDEPNVDWEAIAALRDPAGTAWLAVADIGDNNARYPSVRIALVREPAQLRTGSLTPERVLRLRYPDGPRDAEALLADPRDGRLYLVSKSLFGSELYRVPSRNWPGGAGDRRVSPVITLTKVASISAGLITDGTFLPDGRMLVRGYGQMFLLDRPEAVSNGRIATLASAGLPDQEQGESITVTEDGRTALIGTEGSREPVLRVPVPATEDGAGPEPTATLPEDSPAAAPVPSGTTGTVVAGAEAEPRSGGVGSLRVWALLIGGGIVVTALTLGALRFRPRSRR